MTISLGTGLSPSGDLRANMVPSASFAALPSVCKVDVADWS